MREIKQVLKIVKLYVLLSAALTSEKLESHRLHLARLRPIGQTVPFTPQLSRRVAPLDPVVRKQLLVDCHVVTAHG